MATQPPTQVDPRWIKVTLPEVVLPGCPDAKQLAGDYILALKQPGEWQVEFQPICGFFRMIATAQADHTGARTVRLKLIQGTEQPTWSASSVQDLLSPFVVSIDSRG